MVLVTLKLKKSAHCETDWTSHCLHLKNNHRVTVKVQQSKFITPFTSASTLPDLHLCHPLSTLLNPHPSSARLIRLKPIRFGCSALDFTLYFLGLVLHTLDSLLSSATVPLLLCTAGNLPGSPCVPSRAPPLWPSSTSHRWPVLPCSNYSSFL